jgi:Homeodomain-like domain-containing protein
MLDTAKSANPEVQRRRLAVKMFRAGQKPAAIATQLQRSRRWVYYWVAYQHRHPHTRFRSASSAPHHHPNQTPRQVEQQILHLRQSLIAQRNPRLRYAPAGARTIRRELNKRRVKPCPSLCTIQRIVHRHGLPVQTPADVGLAYRPHPSATYPNAVHATDISTRWLEGGPVVQTFTTVDHFSNTAYATIHAEKNTEAAREPLLATWRQLGVPALAQFDHESVFRGGPHPPILSALVRLCLYLGIAVLFTPIAEADYNWQIETFNHLWAAQFWDKHPFTHRWRIPPALHAFLRW